MKRERDRDPVHRGARKRRSARRPAGGKVWAEYSGSRRVASAATVPEEVPEGPRPSPLRRALAMALASVLALTACGGLWTLAFFSGIKNDLVDAADHAEAERALTPQEDVTEPFTVLLLGDDRRSGETKARADTIIVARVDPGSGSVRMVSVPRDSRVEIPGYGTEKINAAASYGGAPLVVDTVEAYLGVPINHYMMVDFKGFQRVVDAMGGIWIDVDVEIDDKKAASHGKRRAYHIDPGYQLLDGEHALTYVRSREFPDGDFSRMRHQQTFFKALAKQSMSLGNVLKMPNVMKTMARHTTTDMEVSEILALVNAMRGIGEQGVQTATLSGPTQTIGGVSYVIPDEATRQRLRQGLLTGADIEEGLSPTAGDVPPSTVSVTVRNGAGTAGCASDVARRLRTAGYDVETVGNADSFDHDGTLIIHRDADAQAEAVAAALGLGEVEENREGYSFTTDVLVIVGRDWEGGR